MEQRRNVWDEMADRENAVKSTYPEIIIVLDVALSVEHSGDVLSSLRGSRDGHVGHTSERGERSKRGASEDDEVCEEDHGEFQ